MRPCRHVVAVCRMERCYHYASHIRHADVTRAVIFCRHIGILPGVFDADDYIDMNWSFSRVVYAAACARDTLRCAVYVSRLIRALPYLPPAQALRCRFRLNESRR